MPDKITVLLADDHSLVRRGFRRMLDDDPAIEYPACHLNAQDWGVPVRLVAGGPAELTLPLHG